ncbi:MAG: hypothetical protein H6Q89_456 [Myxococcaceae bacterium]|nr:hypothetical protein [Myxococcaceae bacterium]
MIRATLCLATILLGTGCLLPASDGGQDAGPIEATALPDGGQATWYRDVLPVSQARCQGCHTTGGIAPFSMETYAAVKNRFAQIANAVSSRRMPPWMPGESCGMQYVGSRRLSQAEIDVFTAWAAGGGAEGNPADAPAAIKQDALDWIDATVTPASSYTPSATRTDDYHCFLVDPNVTTARSVIGYEVVPGQRSQVHHVLIYAVDKADALAKDNAEAGEGWTCFGASGINNADLIGGWVPGTSNVRYPAGTGIPLAAGKVFAMQIHYNTSAGTRLPDTTTVKLQYARAAVIPATLIPILDYTFSIPPNAMGYTPLGHPKDFPNTLGFDARVWGVLPHMHQKGKRIAITGPRGCMVDIPQWDFHWQQQYFFTAPQLVKKLEKVTLTCTWDNPTTRYVTWGEGTDDEMCLAYLYATL